MQNDAHIIFDMAMQHYDKLLILIVINISMLYTLKRLLRFEDKNLSSKPYTISIFLIMLILIFFGIRGHVAGKSFGISDAFTSSNSQSGNLAINAPFSIIKTLSKQQKKYTFFSTNTAISNSVRLLKSDEFIFTNQKFPLSRESTNKQEKKHNIVIIMLESWSAKYVDSFAGTNFGVTKNFDTLAQNGLQFTNFFANGQRSIDGITALFTGMPVLPNFQYLGHGLELSNLSYIGKIAQNNDYSTLAMQSSKRDSFKISSVSKLAGFETYYGAEDIPSLKTETSGAQPRFGTWDNNMLSFYHQKINTLKEPFLTFAFTSSTHIPFISPGKQWEKYQHGEDSINGFLNTLNYSDDALGKFMSKAKREPWFDNTIFIIMADHTLGFGDDSKMLNNSNIKLQNRELENMRIPMIIYAPKIFPQPQKIERLASQADILPTLTNYLGWHGAISTMSNSVFSNSSKPFVLFTNGNLLGYKTDIGYLRHTLDVTLENTLDTKEVNNALSLYQTFSYIHSRNIITPQ